MREGLEAYLSRVLGSCRVVGELTRRNGETCVLEVEDATGHVWVAKRHHHRGPWQREVRAYRRWTPALGDQAPALRGADKSTHALVLSKIPGVRARNEPTAHRKAGKLLRTLHESSSARPYPDYAAEAERRLEALLTQAPALFDRSEVDYVRGEVRSLHDLPAPSSVPCHLDYAPRNWLIDDGGTLRVIDFAGAQRHVWVRDLMRMAFSNWWDEPALRDAFLDGYGRRPSAEEFRLLLHSGALTAVSRVVWGAQHGLPQVSEDGRRILARVRAHRPGPAAGW